MTFTRPRAARALLTVVLLAPAVSLLADKGQVSAPLGVYLTVRDSCRIEAKEAGFRNGLRLQCNRGRVRMIALGTGDAMTVHTVDHAAMPADLDTVPTIERHGAGPATSTVVVNF